MTDPEWQAAYNAGRADSGAEQLYAALDAIGSYGGESGQGDWVDGFVAGAEAAAEMARSALEAYNNR